MAFSGGDGRHVRSGINVTPLVDVVLVLLIIFLVAMPMVMMNVEIDIPNPPAEPSAYTPEPLTVEVTEAGAILLGGVEVLRTELAPRLRERLELSRDKVVFVDFHDDTVYGAAVSIVDTVKGAGAAHVAMKMRDPAGRPDPAAR